MRSWRIALSLCLVLVAAGISLTHAQGVRHRLEATLPDNPDHEVSSDEWNDTHVMTGGTHHDTMIRDTGQPDGWDWHSMHPIGLPGCPTPGHVPTSNGTVWECAAPPGAATGAPTTAGYWTKTPDATLTNEVALSTLATGILLNTTTTGVPTIYAGTGPVANQFMRSLNASGVGTFTQVGLLDLNFDPATQAELDAHTNTLVTSVHGSTSTNTANRIVQRDASGNFTAGTITANLSGNATTATALQNNPVDCPAGQFAHTIAATGNLTCDDVATEVEFQSHVSTTTAHAAATAVHGATGAVMGTTNTQSVSNKTFDNSNIATFWDTRVTLQDQADTTKQAVFEVSGVPTGTTRTVTIAGSASSVTVVPKACVGTDKFRELTADGVFLCDADQAGSAGTGITSLNGLEPVTQLLAVGTAGTDIAWSSVTATHTLNVPDASATARGVVTTGTQTFAGQKTFSTGLTGTLTGNASTASVLAANGANCGAEQAPLGVDAAGAAEGCFAVLTPTSTAEVSNKSLQDSTTWIVDQADNTKRATFEVSGIATGQTRTVTLPNANSVTVVSSAAVTSQFLTEITTGGVTTRAQPAFSDISGTATKAQISDTGTWNETEIPVLTTGKYTDALLVDGSRNAQKLVFSSTGASPVNRQLQVVDGLVQAASLAGTEGRYIKKESLEVLASDNYGNDSITLGTKTTGNYIAQLTAGTNMTLANCSPGESLNCTINVASAYRTIQDEAAALTQRQIINFTGPSVACVDNAGASRTDCTITGTPTPGGSDTQVQFNDAGVLFGEAGLTYNKTTDVLTAVGGFVGLTDAQVPSTITRDSELAAWDLQDAFGAGKEITGANSEANAALVGDGTVKWKFWSEGGKPRQRGVCDPGPACDLEFTGETDKDILLTTNGTGEINFTVPEADRITYTQGVVSGRIVPVLMASTTLSALSGATATATNLIPGNSILEGVRVKVTTLITGATSFDVGDADLVNKWGDNIAVALDTETNIANFAATTPVYNLAARNVVLTANGGNFTAGAVQVVAYYRLLPGFP